MAFLNQGQLFFSDNRDLVDVNIAGISTALLVGPNGAETFQVGEAGIATAFSYVLSGDDTIVIDTFQTSIAGSGLDTELPTTKAIVDYVAAQGVSGGGTIDTDNINLSGWIAVGQTATFDGTVTFDGADTNGAGFKIGPSGQEILEISTETDLGGASPLDSSLPTQAAVKTYIDTQFADNNTLEIEAEGGGVQSLDLTGDNINFTGGNSLTAGIVVSGLPGAETYSVEFALDDDVTINTSLTFDGTTFNNVVTSADDLLEGGANDNDTTLATYAAVLDAVGSATGGGTATAGTIAVSDSGDNNAVYTLPMFLGAADGSQESLVGDDQLTYNPSTGRLNAQEFNSLSDIRFKENIELIESPLAKVDALRGVTYNWKTSGGASAGIIAQEVQAVMPELIAEGEDRLTVNYNGLIGLLIEAVKEQQSQIEELKSMIG